MMPLLRIALALLEQDIHGASRGTFLRRTALIAVSSALLSVGSGFLIAAGYLALEVEFGAPVAAAIVGGALCLVAGLVLVGVTRRTSLPPRLPNRIVATMSPAAGVIRWPDRDDAQALANEVRRVIDVASPLTTAFFLCGLAVGVIARWSSWRRAQRAA